MDIRINLRDSEIDDLANLLAVVQPFQIFPSLYDSRLRTPSLSGTFSVSLFYSALFSSSSSSSFPHNAIWFPLLPFKVQVFFRKVAWNRGSTLDIIQAVYPHITLSPNYCPMHFSIAESKAHLFYPLPFSWKLRDKLFELANFSIAIPATLTELCTSWR